MYLALRVLNDIAIMHVLSVNNNSERNRGQANINTALPPCTYDNSIRSLNSPQLFEKLALIVRKYKYDADTNIKYINFK